MMALNINNGIENCQVSVSYTCANSRFGWKGLSMQCHITVNVAGQVGQIRLPTSKALWPLFETVINSIQSLEESDTKKKVIVIDALRPEHTQLKTGEQGRTIMAKERMVDDV